MDKRLWHGYEGVFVSGYISMVIARMPDSPKYSETLRDTYRYKQINDTLFRQRITVESGTDL